MVTYNKVSNISTEIRELWSHTQIPRDQLVINCIQNNPQNDSEQNQVLPRTFTKSKPKQTSPWQIKHYPHSCNHEDDKKGYRITTSKQLLLLLTFRKHSTVSNIYIKYIKF